MRFKIRQFTYVLGLICLFYSNTLWAYDQHYESNLWAEGYSVPTQTGTLLARRRIVEELSLNVWNILPDSNHPYYQGPRLSIALSFRLNTDFAMKEPESTPSNDEAYVPGLTPIEMEAQLAYIFAEGLWNDTLNLRLGRQYRLDTTGFFAFDGIEGTYFFPAGLSLSSFLGYEIRGGKPLGYDQFELDGTDNGGREDMNEGRYPHRSNSKSTMVAGTELGWSLLPWLDMATSVRTVGFSDETAEQKVAGRLAVGGRPVLFTSRILWSPMLDRQDDLGAAIKEGTVVTEAEADLDLTITEKIAVNLSYQLFRPTFEADSIFNIFDLTPRRDAGIRLSTTPTEAISLATWGYLRFADDSAGISGEENSSILSGVGGGAGGNYQVLTRRFSVRVTGSKQWGETRIGSEIGGGQGLVNNRLWLGLRASAFRINDDFSPKFSGDIIGYVASLNVKIAKGAHVLIEIENYFGTELAPRVIALAHVQLDLWR